MKNLVEFEENGTPIVSDQGVIELLYQDKLESVFEWENTNSKKRYADINRKLDTFPLFQGKLDISNRDWFTPDDYLNINLENYILSRCKNSEEKNRAKEELSIVEQLRAEPIFKHLIYLIDKWRSENKVWGVGRGSSVSCFLLYVIGLNKINPLEYDLDYNEFFKLNKS